MAALGSCYCFNCIVAQMKFYITVSQIGLGWKEKLFRRGTEFVEAEFTEAELIESDFTETGTY